jgi:hypothetical protein
MYYSIYDQKCVRNKNYSEQAVSDVVGALTRSLSKARCALAVSKSIFRALILALVNPPPLVDSSSPMKPLRDNLPLPPPSFLDATTSAAFNSCIVLSSSASLAYKL